MVQGYFTLQEAAEFLGMPIDELRQMAQKGKIRSFQDRGTLRFRTQDIQELARQRGQTSDPELPLGEASLPPPKAPSSASRKKGPKSSGRKNQPEAPDVFEFAFDGDEGVDLGGDFLGPKSQPVSRGKKSPVATRPSAGSDSDVRLVPDGSDVTFSVGRDSDVKLADSNVKLGAAGPKSSAASSGKPSSEVSLGSGVQQPKSTGKASKLASPKPGSGPQLADSGVRLVPMDSDSDVKIVGASDELPLGLSEPASQTDSNVRLDRIELPPADSGEGGMLLTEEINLDEEIRKQEELEKDLPQAKMKAKSELKFPSSSPFELSDSELQMPEELMDSGGPKTPRQVQEAMADSSDFEMSSQMSDGSSDFDLTPAKDEDTELGDSDDFSIEASDDHEQALADEPTELTSSSSGISLGNPLDAGISLEEGGGADDNVDFDLSLELEDTPRPMESSPADDSEGDFQLKVEDTPRPVEANPADSDSEFELTLDSDPDLQAGQAAAEEEPEDIDFSLDAEEQADGGRVEDDSEFEINLDGSDEGAATDAGSDSEFELTLDDADAADAGPQVKSKKKPADDEQDIFETDFEVPALDDSDDSTVADSELESSDFDLALDDSDLASEDESGSQVVALDEEEDIETLVEGEDDNAVVDDIEVEEEASGFDALDEDVEVDAEVEVDEDADADDDGTGTKGAGKKNTVVKEKMVEAAPWGVLPVIFMLPCVVVMFLVGILGFEMVQSSVGMRPPGPLTVLLAEQLGEKLTNKR